MRFEMIDLHISAYSAKLHVRDGIFQVAWLDEKGVAQKEEHAPARVRSIWLQEGTVVTVAAIFLAQKMEIDLLFLDRGGMPQSRVWGYELHGHSAVQKGQAIASAGPVGLELAKTFLAQKLANQANFLELLKKRRDDEKQAALEKGAVKIRQFRQQLLTLDAARTADVADSLRGLEGSASKAYFQSISAILPEEYRFDGRSRQPATDVFNAFLNYGYAFLYAKTQRALLMAGINPFIGMLHRDDYRHKSMVYDFVEPWRVWIDRPVVALFSRKTITTAHVAPAPQGEGGLWLNGEGKKIFLDALAAYFAEKKAELGGLLVSRDQFLLAEARSVGQRFLGLAGAKPGGREPRTVELFAAFVL